MTFVGFILFCFLALIALATYVSLRKFEERIQFIRYSSFMALKDDLEFAKLKINQEREETLEAYFRCNGCYGQIYEGKNRYHCTECIDFDFCETCFNHIGHPHLMIAETMRPSAIQEKIKSYSTTQNMINAFTYYAKRPCLGWRLRDKNTGKLEITFTFKTFEQTWEHIRNFGFGLRTFINPRDFIGICSRNRYEYYVADYACMVHSIIGPIIPHAIDEDGMKSIINTTEMKCIVCGIDTVEKVLNCLPHCPSVKTIIFINDEDHSKSTLNLTFENVRVYDFTEIEELGKNQTFAFVDTKPDEIFTLTYTSGSTGDPKGVIILEKVWHSNMTNLFRLHDPDIAPSWSNSDRKNDWRQLMYGGRVGIYSGDVNLIFEDIRLLRPTAMSATPVFWNKIYSEYKNTVEALRSQYDTEEEARQEALEKFSTLLGDRIDTITTGGAATSPEVMRFMRQCFKCSVNDSYGATEVGAITSGFRAKNYVQTKLEPWEEYSPEDKPYPRGELCVKSPYMAAGYYKNEEKTKEVFIDGWYHTGDIVEVVGEQYQVIDRKKNIFKLAQGEFVAPSRLENFFVESSFIEQIYVHGDVAKSFLLAVVIPNMEVAEQWCKLHGKEFDSENICKDTSFSEEIHKDIVRIGAKNRLRNFEIPFGVILTKEKFTEQNHMLNTNHKVVRHAIAKRYRKELKELYDGLETKQEGVQDKLLQLLSSAIGLDGISEENKHEFKKTPLLQLGTDSLSAIKIQNMLKTNLNINVPISVIVSEGANIEKLANYMNSPQVDPMDEFDLDRELQHDFTLFKPSYNNNIDNINKGSIIEGSVLLTGSCGFLGLQLLHDLLLENKTVYCLLRPNKEMNGLERIKERFKFAKFEWKQEYETKVIPVDGDLSMPLMGIMEDKYKQLLDVIEEVYHVAAYVNSVLPYFSLKKSNVDGTKHVVNFCIDGRNKLLHHVSTASVCVTPETRVEQRPVYEQGNTLYKIMGGYNLSKFVAERFVWKTMDEGDLRAIIYRPGMVSSSSVTGYCNLDDFDNRLLVGLLQCKSVPINTNASMESNSVDFIAKTMLLISKQGDKAIGKVFNLVNPNRLKFDKEIQLLTKKVEGLKPMTYDIWKRDVLPKLGADNPIYPMITEYFGRRNWFPARDSTSDCSNTIAALQMHGLKFEEISEQMLHTWIDFVLEHAVVDPLNGNN